MKLLIDNLDGLGLQDYTPFLDAAKAPRVLRTLNRPAQLQARLVLSGLNTVVPAAGARLTLSRSDGTSVFTGYIVENPTYEPAGLAPDGPLCTHALVAGSDETMLDQKTPPLCPAFVARSAGAALRQLTSETLAGWFDTTAVDNGDTIPYYQIAYDSKWSKSAAEISLLSRCVYRCNTGDLSLAPLGSTSYDLVESAAGFTPASLVLQSARRSNNDVTVFGLVEPDARVTDYFVGDGYTTKFYLSEKPYTRGTAQSGRTLLDEEYTKLDLTHWTVSDPSGAVAVSSGKLQVAGGTGVDGQTLVGFIEQVELGGAVQFEHGDVQFNAASDGVLGGLYTGAVSIGACLAGFRLTAPGGSTQIQALVQGALAGTAMTTQATHHYVFTTRVYSTEIYRMGQVFHSSAHASGAPRGGTAAAADVRIVLEVHDIDPSDPATQIAPATVLYDDVVPNAPGFCTYALVNAAGMNCSVAFTRIFLPLDAVVRSTVQGENTRTRRSGLLLEGAECRLSEEPALQFYPQYAPEKDETIEVTYRGRGRAMARVTDSGAIAARRRGNDDGVRGEVRQIKLPAPRTSEDCETAALALLDDAGDGWAGEYKVWSSFLPGGARDIFPADGLAMQVPSRAAVFNAIVTEVSVEVADLEGENCEYTLRFVDAGDPTLDFVFEAAATVMAQHSPTLQVIDKTAIATAYLADLSSASANDIASTTVTIDAGVTPGTGQVVEVRLTDNGWGTGNDRNLVGRFTARSFTVPRYGKVQDYFLRIADNNSPPRYSRHSAALHIDYPY